MRIHWHRPSIAATLALALAVPLFAASATAPATAAAPLSTVVINEVENDGGTPGDWVELTNIGTETTDVSGWIMKDDKDERNYAIPTGSLVAPGEFLAVDVDGPGETNFGLGKVDEARLFLPDGTTLVDSYAWPFTGQTTWGRCTDGTGDFRETNSSTRGAANDCEISVADNVRINEVESSGDANDWIELINIGNAAVDVTGLVVKDNDDTHAVNLPADSVITAGGFLVLEDPTLTFGLGGADSARLFADDGTTLIDEYDWTTHASTTYGRCPDGIGDFATTSSSTKGLANECVPTEVASIRINEVESSGGAPGDWVELFNFGTTPIDLSGWIVQDSEDTHVTVLADSSSIAAGEYFVIEESTLGYGLGANEMVRLYEPNGYTLVDSVSWLTHAATTYGLCGSATELTTMTSATKGAANDCGSPLRINEVESNDGTPGDWIEIKNNGATDLDAGGFILRDNDDTHAFVVPTGTIVAAGGYYAADVDSDTGFGLGKADSARLFTVDGTLVDSYTWSAHAATSYGRCTDGTGEFVTTIAATKGASNSCEGDLVTSPWPGSPTTTTVDPAGVLGGNMSGLAYESSEAGDVLWAAKNGPGALYRLVSNGSQWIPDTANSWGTGKQLHYPDGTGDVDAEGVALTSAGASGGLFVASERDNSVSGVSRPSVLRYDASAVGTSLSATLEWNLTADLPTVGANAGLEAIAWVPDSVLVAEGFVDETTNATYNPAQYAGHGTGLFFVGLEANGTIYAYALDQTTDAYTRVATIDSGFTGVMDLEFEAETSNLWAVCDDTCEGRSAVLDVAQSGENDGRFTITSVFERPASMPNINNEGFALAPQSACLAGTKTAFWADDSNTDGFAIRAGSITCSGLAVTDPTIPAAVDSELLTEANRGPVSSPASATPGTTITLAIPGHSGSTVDVWLHSTPVLLGTFRVSAAGTVQVIIPVGTTPGTHRIAVTAADGTLIGWDDITVMAQGAVPGASLADTGVNAALPSALALLLLLAGVAVLRIRRRAQAAG